MVRERMLIVKQPQRMAISEMSLARVSNVGGKYGPERSFVRLVAFFHTRDERILRVVGPYSVDTNLSADPEPE